MRSSIVSGVALLSLLSVGCRESTKPAASDFRITVQAVVEDDAISVWEFEVTSSQDCKLVCANDEGERNSTWLRAQEGAEVTGRVVVAISLAKAKGSEKATLTCLARIHANSGYAGGPSTYQIDAPEDGLSSVVKIDVQDQDGDFGTPISLGTVDGRALTLTVEN